MSKPAVTTPAKKVLSLNVVERVKNSLARSGDDQFWQNDLDGCTAYPHITEAINDRGIGDFIRMQVCIRNGFFKNYTPLAA